MTEQALRKMIAAGESTRQEFKSWVKCKDYRQQKGIVQKLVDLMEGGAGEGALLLLGREVSPFAAHILTAGGLAQGVVQGFDVVGPQLLHLHLPDIGDDEVLDERQIGLVGLGRPLVFAALLGQPIHQELCYRHRGRRLSIATPIRASFCHRTGACRSLSQPLFRISRNQGVTH